VWIGWRVDCGLVGGGCVALRMRVFCVVESKCGRVAGAGGRKREKESQSVELQSDGEAA
jgi:hypothetical protein